MEETQLESINTPNLTEFLKKAAKTILPRIPINLAAQTSRSVRIVLTLKEPNLETKETVGPLPSTPSGR